MEKCGGKKMNRKKISILVVLTLVLTAFIIMPKNVNAADTIIVDATGFGDHTTIQAGINAAVTGDTVLVKAGTYAESLSIDAGKSIDVIGEPGAIIKCPTTPRDIKIPESSHYFEQVVLIAGGTYNAGNDTIYGPGVININFEGFQIDCNNYIPTHSRFAAILCRNIHGCVKNCDIINTSFDGKETFGILCYGDIDITIEGNTIDKFGRGGIGVNSGTCLIKDNTIIGPGLGVPVTWAPNGIQVGYGATGNIEGNEVSGCGWPGSAWSGTGILVVDTNNVTVDDNYVHDNEQAIGAVDFPKKYGAPWDALVLRDIIIQNNIIEDNEWGIEISNDASNIFVYRNNILNTIHDSIDVYNYSAGQPGEVPTNVEIHCNQIDGSGGDGLWVGDYVTNTVDAENNWWGDPSGPSGDGPGTGDTVIGNADYDPWLPTPNACNYVWVRNGYEKSMPTYAKIVLGGSGDSTGPSGGTGADAPVIHYAWVWEDEDSSKTGTQVTCVPSGYKTGVEVKIVISDPNGLDDIEDVKAQIIYPEDAWPWCGCPKFKIEASQILDSTIIEQQAYNARQAGLITAGQYDEILSKIDNLSWAMYVGYFDMWYCEPAGNYDVLVWGIDGAYQIGEVYSIAAHQTSGFGFEFVECLVMEHDFNSLDYGNIRPSVTQYIYGDTDLNTPEEPTVKNEGNVPIKIRIKSSPLVMANTEYEIDEFDYRFKNSGTVTYSADTWVDIGPTLCVCNTEKLDLSIHAREGLPQGEYSGTFYIQIYKGSWGQECED